MWSDNDIDNAFQRLNPPEPEPTPFPLDAWLRLETELDKAAIERAVRRRVWRLFAAEVVLVTLIALGWLFWPAPNTGSSEAGLAAKTSPTGTRVAASAANSATALRARASSQAAVSADGSPASVSAIAAAAVAGSATPATAAGSALATPNASAASASAVSEAVYRRAAVARTIRSRPRAINVARTARGRERKVRAAVSERRNRAKQSETTRTISSRNSMALAGAAPNRRRRQSARTSRLTAETLVASHQASAIGVVDVPAARASSPARESQAIYQPHPKAAAAETAVATAASVATASITSSKSTLPKAQRQAGGLETEAASNPGTSASTANAAVNQATAGLLARPVLLAPTTPAALPTAVGAVAVAPAEVVGPVRRPRFCIGLVGAPDVTTVKFAGVESPLLNAGIALEYRLTPRFRLTTGVLRAKKQYMAQRDEYYWGAYKELVYKHDFEDVDGTCTVLDIPLNLRYDFLIRSDYSLFGSLGLSSFFMQRERYTYSYEENNMHKLWDGGEIINQNRHLFRVLNLSAGYERRLGAHWSLQAEPYLKLPLAGVGAGKVKLTSAGVFLGVKYGF